MKSRNSLNFALSGNPPLKLNLKYKSMEIHSGSSRLLFSRMTHDVSQKKNNGHVTSPAFCYWLSGSQALKRSPLIG